MIYYKIRAEVESEMSSIPQMIQVKEDQNSSKARAFKKQRQNEDESRQSLSIATLACHLVLVIEVWSPSSFSVAFIFTLQCDPT